MKAILITFVFFLSVANVLADECEKLERTEYIPTEYLQSECRGKKALANKQYKIAIVELEKALSVKLYEAANYQLNIELAQAYCEIGDTEKGKNLISEFICMAKAELMQFDCPEVYDNPEVSSECASLACEGSGWVLSEKGKDELHFRIKKAEHIRSKCTQSEI